MTITELYAKYSGTRYPLASLSDISEFESKIERTLPQDYRQFLLTYNGGYFRGPVLTAEGDSEYRDSLDHFYSLGTPIVDSDLLRNTYLFDDNIPCLLLPIGYTIAGNMVLYDFMDKSQGEVLVKLASKWVFIFLAESFSDLIAKCLRDPSASDD